MFPIDGYRFVVVYCKTPASTSERLALKWTEEKQEQFLAFESVWDLSRILLSLLIISGRPFVTYRACNSAFRCSLVYRLIWSPSSDRKPAMTMAVFRTGAMT